MNLYIILTDRGQVLSIVVYVYVCIVLLNAHTYCKYVCVCVSTSLVVPLGSERFCITSARFE